MLLPLKQGLKPLRTAWVGQPPRVVMLLPLKQGLKLGLTMQVAVLWYLVVMLLPLKQGLKQDTGDLKTYIGKSCYATSIKTRIETQFRLVLPAAPRCCYATSIKTRIETYVDVAPREKVEELLCYFH